MKRHRRLAFAGVSLLALSLPATSQELLASRPTMTREQAQKVIQESEQQVDSILKKEIHLPGLAVALVSRDEVLWAKAFGYRDALRREKADTNTLYVSYIGGRSFMSSDLSWTSPGKVMVYGSTSTKSLPLSDSAYSRESKGERDGFVAIFDSENMKLEYSTLFGGSQFDFIRSGFFLGEDRIVSSGETNSPDLPLTENALHSEYPVCDKTFNNTFFGERRFFVSIIDIKKGRLVYSTFFGSGVRFQAFPDKQGNLGFVAEAGVREVPATDFPVSKDAFRVPPTYFMVGRLTLSDSPVGM